MPSLKNRLAGIVAFSLGLLSAACPVQARQECDAGTDDFICSDFPPDVCPEGFRLAIFHCGGHCCALCTILEENPGCFGDVSTGLDCPADNETTIIDPLVPVDCDEQLPSCWVYTCVDDPRAEYPNGCLITFHAHLVDSCDPEEEIHWTICQGSGLVTVVGGTDDTLTVRVKGSGALTVVAKQLGGTNGPYSREKKVIVGSACLGDINHDGTVDGGDLGQLLGDYGSPGCGGASTCCESDLDGDGDVGGADLGMLLGAYGACP